MHNIFRILTGRRTLLTRLTVAAVLAYAVLASPPDYLRGLEVVSELTGFLLLGAATLGRVWCVLFIGGAKNDTLITEGPYSVVRNPLYVFNFIGLVGLGLAIEQPTVAVVLAVMFWLYYPSVVVREEAELLNRFGPAFAAYQEQTPRWIPRLQQYHEPFEMSVKPLRIRHGIFGAMWLLWTFLFWEVVEELHYVHAIPLLF
jgi:protein-S-isoprenylcysteine O-methyltransferase Ste14